MIITEASPVRFRDHLPNSADVIVIGAGIFHTGPRPVMDAVDQIPGLFVASALLLVPVEAWMLGASGISVFDLTGVALLVAVATLNWRVRALQPSV